MTSTTLRKRFCKDMGLPINIFTSPYFESRLELVGATEEYQRFLTMIDDRFDGDGGKFLDYYDSVRNAAIEYIKQSETLKALQTLDMQAYAVKDSFPDKDVYKNDYVGRWFFSLDMKKANYSSLVYLGKQLNKPFVSDEIGYDYEKFMRQFTDIEHIIKSKNIRQAIFGSCCGNRQSTYEKYMMRTLLGRLFEAGLPREDVLSLRADEILLANKEVQVYLTIEEVVKDNDFPVKFENFHLLQIIDAEDAVRGYIKHIPGNNDEFELKCVGTDDYPFVQRMLRGEQVQDEDSVFLHDGKLARFLEVPELRIKYKQD